MKLNVFSIKTRTFLHERFHLWMIVLVWCVRSSAELVPPLVVLRSRICPESKTGHKLHLKHQTWAWTWPSESSGNPDVSLAPAIIMQKWVSALINIFSRLPSIKRAELWENTENLSTTRDKSHLQSQADATRPVSAYLLTSPSNNINNALRGTLCGLGEKDMKV